MLPPFDDPAVRNHRDEVGPTDGCQSVGYHQRGSVSHQTVERASHRQLGLRIEGRGGLVEDEDRGILEEGTGDGQALALATGKPEAGLADHRVESPGQIANELVSICPAGGGLHSFRGKVVAPT